MAEAAGTEVDVVALYRALDRARETRQLSWRQAAQQVGVSASTMSRLAQDLKPDVNAFARMVRWLEVPAETFIREDGELVVTPADGEQELVAQLAPLLRARRDLEEPDVQHLEELITSAVRRFKADRSAKSK
jgi:transcriptional regulator with XRE-family HTH domain